VTLGGSAIAYDRFMGRFSIQLSPQLADFAKVVAGQRVLDVGCGTGALTAELVQRLGPESVSAVDPSEPFVAALRARHPGVDVLTAAAEDLPYPDQTFDASLAQLVVHFMTDPVVGLGEMKRVTRANGVVVASAWEYASDRGPLGPFWEAAYQFDPALKEKWERPEFQKRPLPELFQAAGLQDVEETTTTATIEYATIDDWWEPFTLGVSPAGDYVAHLDPERRFQLREMCRELLPEPPFTQTAFAIAVRGRR
jgi:ubiquinone/menaquinone biosynthesis C-methylase UbiE